ncbi:Gamma-glutamyltranspeptidase [Ceratobasidium theobromae]|uniref:Glutathione hydrolase n=1 Tax=Ceratobasidium theobromae TaxID=1582974 RepID=A0A5N5QI13_9AGAM|nr:Gamma-glutamyltranspeptidase [Ceratobasidium theobromae]
MLFSDGVLIYLCLVSLTSASPARLPTEPAGLTSTAMSSYGKRGAVATEVKQCSDLGVELIKKGGNAADAMIGAQLCVGTVAAYHSGIGGGGFMLVRSPNGSYETIDFREFAPGNVTELMYVNKTGSPSQVGGLSVAVPGELRGFEALHGRHGKLPWKEIFKPVVKLAKGFEVSRELARVLASNLTYITEDPVWAAVYAPNGTVAVAGQIIHRPIYAKTLQRIANEGVDVFYTGSIAKNSVATAQAGGGIITLDDFKKYKVVIRKPVQIKYRNYTITSCPAPSSGIIALSALNILENFDISNSSNINVTTHLLDEAIKFAYGQRMSIGDPAFVTNVTTLQAYYLQKSTSKELANRISLGTTYDASYYDPGKYVAQRESGTSHLVTADASGMVVSLTSTVNYYFGSQLMTSDGIILNDEMDDFSTPGTSNGFGYIATPANYIAPYKRPLSSISPTIVEDNEGNFRFATGAAGGSRIITATLQSLWHVLDEGMDVQSAIDAPRFHDQIVPMTTTFEYKYDNATICQLSNYSTYMASLGHNVSWVAPGQSVVQAVARDSNGVFSAASDGRKLDSGSTIY